MINKKDFIRIYSGKGFKQVLIALKRKQCNYTQAEELTQVAWVKAYEKLEQCEATTEVTFIAWVKRIAINEWLATKREGKHKILAEAEVLIDIVDTKNITEDIILTRITLDKLISYLPIHYQKYLIDYHILGKRAAVQFSTDKKSIQVRLRANRALWVLRAKIAAKMGI